MSERAWWYVVARSTELSRTAPLQAVLLDEPLVLFRDAHGQATALQDRCRHRAGKLSAGRLVDGCVRCPYHGWTYDRDGQVVAVPAEGEGFEAGPHRAATAYATVEQDGYVYVRLASRPWSPERPARLPAHDDRRYGRVTLVNTMQNTVTNCVENFVDVPHTVDVHPGIFRTERRERLEATVVRAQGEVCVTYRGETDNVGWFSWLLNPRGEPLEHTDRFLVPNRTRVDYRFGPRRHVIIHSQSVPVGPTTTRVYTDLLYDMGWMTPFTGPVIAWQGQQVIDQDIAILAQQAEVIAHFGADFAHTPVDLVHLHIERLRAAVLDDADPFALPEAARDLVFWV